MSRNPIRSFRRLLSSNDAKKSGEQISLLTNNKRLNDYLSQLYAKSLRLMSVYEEAIGIREIKNAQQKVLKVGILKFFFKWVLFILFSFYYVFLCLN